jgi:glutamyl-tRNA(Gln) amidotransferase subunit D
MSPKDWKVMAENVIKDIGSFDGIVISHGTDTMAYSASALSFMLKDLNKPVILVGSQRSSDRPSSDGVINLLNAMTVAGNADLAEVAISMLGTSDHIYGFIHRGTRVRKMHSSARHTFRTIGDIPLGYVFNGKVDLLKDDIRRRRDDITPYAESNIEEKVALIHSYPGMDPEIIEHYIDKGYKGLVLAGTGLGHFPHTTFKALERANQQGIVMTMVVQTLWGFTGMDVYVTGRELQGLGIIPGQNMLPETAYAKMVWALGKTQDRKEVERIMSTNIAGEITKGELPNGYQIMQGIESSLKLLPKIGTKKIVPSFSFLDHTADVWIHAKGNTIEEGFEQCVYAMMKVMTDPNKIDRVLRKDVSAKAGDLKQLLVKFLTEFLVLFDSEFFLVSKIVVNPIKFQNNEYSVQAYALGETFDEDKHLRDTEIKAITFMQLEITEVENHYEIKIVYDI